MSRRVTETIVRRAVIAGLLTAALLACAGPAGAAFPGTNGKIAFSTFQANNYDVFAANPDGIGFENLSGTPDASEYGPAWSPDGRRIAYMRDDDTTGGAIWVMNADGSGQAQLTGGFAAGASDGEPAWSPDGTQIVFTRIPDGGDPGLWVMADDGSAARRLTTGDDNSPAWSPNGTTIVFERNNGLAIVNADGSSAVQTVNTGLAAPNLEPSWSPDGSMIALVWAPDKAIAIVKLDATVVSRMFACCATRNPEWSPDGSAIAFDDVPGLSWLALDGSASGTVSTVPSSNSPTWQPASVAPVGNTPVGANVVVSPVDPATGGTPVTITFASVTAAGDTTVVSSSAGPPPPAGFEILGRYYEFATTAQFTSAEVCFEYSGTPPSIVHFGGTPSGILTPSRVTAQQVCADVQTFSPFALVRRLADTEPPTLSPPPSLVVNATSPAGAVVTYSVSATDAVDPSPSVSCSPGSGSTFPIGLTTVSCTATDAAGNSASGSFSVLVKGAKEQLGDLIQKVVAASQLPPAAKTALIAKLQALLASFDPSKPAQRKAVCLALNVFKAAVQLQSGKTIPPAQAAEWIADANRIRAVLAC